MLLVKQELLDGLVAALDRLSPGAGARAAFESPKVAAHGDFACTAAMQLAKPLRQNPRQLAETLKEELLALPAYQRWVESIEIAGPVSAGSDTMPVVLWRDIATPRRATRPRRTEE